jgi:hypothetical protein
LRKCALVAALACLIAAPAARADGDPASDYLLGLPAFIPPDAGVPRADAKQLTGVLATTKARGYQIRVALIATAYDMGAVRLLFHQPRQYARFLGQELAFVYKGRLLVAMPNGYAISRSGKLLPAEQAVVDRLPPPGTNAGALAAGATTAVQKLAAAAGVTVPAVSKPAAAGGSRNTDRLVIGIAGLVLLACASATVVVRRRRPA